MDLFQQPHGVLFGFVAGQFQQRVFGVGVGEGLRQVGEMLADQAQADVGHQLEAGQRRPGRFLRQVQEGERRRGELDSATSAVIAGLRLRKQFQHGAP